jgi:hypothetical protein
MVGAPRRCVGLPAGASREFAPAGDLLFERPKRRQKVAPAPSPLAMLGVPCDARNPRLARNSLRYAAFKQPREVRPRSGLRPRLGLLRFSAPPKGSEGTAKPDILPVRAVRVAPFSTAEERKDLKPYAQRTSRTDPAQLFERSVAKRVLRGASRPDVLSQDRAQHLRAVRRLTKDLPHASGKARREPAAQRRAVRLGGVSLPTFLSTQESRSPAGAKSRHHARRETEGG